MVDTATLANLSLRLGTPAAEDITPPAYNTHVGVTACPTANEPVLCTTPRGEDRRIPLALSALVGSPAVVIRVFTAHPLSP